VRLSDGAFTDDDVEVLTQIANQVAIAVENALSFREIDALKNKLAEEKLYLEEEIRTSTSSRRSSARASRSSACCSR
jgi:formate hydrogenlyase transcriptional activator